MPVGAWSTWSTTLAFAMLIACGKDHATASTPLEQAIEATLGKRLGIPVGARCVGRTCGAMTVDGTVLPIHVVRAGQEVEWKVEGLLVTSDALEAYLRDEITELGAPQSVTCAPRIRRVTAGDRITCQLEHGGIVFVTIRADGSTSLETLLDPVAAKARNELVTPELEEELARASRALENSEEAGEESEEDDAAGELLAPQGSR